MCQPPTPLGVARLDASAHGGPAQAASLLPALEDAAAIVDEADRIIGWNAAAALRFSLAFDAVRGRTLAELGLPTPDDPASIVRVALTAGAGGGALIVWRASRETLPPEALQLQKARALGWLAGPIRHDLANPLNGIMGFASLVNDDERIPEDLREIAGLLDDQANRTLGIIGSLLETLRIREAEPRVLALAPLVRDVLLLETGTLTRVESVVDVPDDLPEVFADPARLRQVLLAITVNAIVALGGREAQGRLRVAAAPGVTNGRAVVRLVIEDSAPVVPEAARSRLFAAFPGPVEGDGRQGLDLAVAARLAALDHGRLRYEPLPDGNRMVLDLLPASRAAEVLRQQELAGEAGPGVGGPQEAAAPITVLVCDDDAPIRTLIARVLQRAGMRTIEAASGAEALELVTDAAVSAVLADHRMAEMTGTELYERTVASRPDLAKRYLLMSGDAGDAELASFAEAAGLQILQKPFDLASLPATVRAAAAR